MIADDEGRCPSCYEMGVGPDRIVANQAVRAAVSSLQIDSGYVRVQRQFRTAQDELVERAIENVEKKTAGALFRILFMLYASLLQPASLHLNCQRYCQDY